MLQTLFKNYVPINSDEQLACSTIHSTENARWKQIRCTFGFGFGSYAWISKLNLFHSYHHNIITMETLNIYIHVHDFIWPIIVLYKYLSYQYFFEAFLNILLTIYYYIYYSYITFIWINVHLWLPTLESFQLSPWVLNFISSIF